MQRHNFRQTRFSTPVFLFAVAAAGPSEARRNDVHHLFILSGQSNMAGLRPQESFTPAVSHAFGTECVTVVKDAQGGQPIRRWHKNWRPASGKPPETRGDLYDRLINKVKRARQGRAFTSVTFVWMQGERDAREKHGTVYLASLMGLIQQLEADLERTDINVVIGRLSDFDLANKRYPHWTRVRQAQQAFVKGHPRAALVNTDDLNDGTNRKGKTIKNDLHLSAQGYRLLGARFADRAIRLIRKAAP
ncbi:MAG TPA: acetyl xylan esterase [Planctomycetaceae bacterium]|nr:acetyl xylan esterase [Planctomycetaceae bacterium]|tara:strand:- start:561 stop:1301 length:741 start_codon:yes stop_codon:yes gene_type:complete